MIKSRNLLPLQSNRWQDIRKIYLKRFTFAASFYALAFCLAGILATIKTFEKKPYLQSNYTTTHITYIFSVAIVLMISFGIRKIAQSFTSKDEQRKHNNRMFVMLSGITSVSIIFFGILLPLRIDPTKTSTVTSTALLSSGLWLINAFAVYSSSKTARREEEEED
jgi:uncharacterized membrane protein HdeD (DUF308 family)